MATLSQTPSLELTQGHWVVDGTGWSFSAFLYDTTRIQHKEVPFDPSYIQLFEYTNQWNQLILTGQLVYKDASRDMGKFFRMPHLVVNIEWSENEAQKKDLPENEMKEATGDYWVEKPVKMEDNFSQLFLVNKMEIINHDTKTDITTYRLELVSIQWYKLSQVCQYSNYNLKKPEPITDIICKLLIDAVGQDMVDTKTFKEPPCTTNICIYYTTTQKDNYFTAINYLLNRMYMEPSSFDVDNHPRIILWDEKVHKYKMAKISDDTTCLEVKDSLIQLKRFYDTADFELSLVEPGAGNMHNITPTVASFSKMSYTRFIKDYYTRHYWDMNITKDKFVRRIIMNEKIQNLFKSPTADPRGDATYYPNIDITSKEDVPELQEFIGNKTNYLIDECKWNNQRHMYNDCIQSIANRDTFILTRSNRVNHQPWQVFYTIRDKEMMKEKQIVDVEDMKIEQAFQENENPNTIPAKTKPNHFSDNQFFGPWFSFKTTHSIVINGTSIEGVPTMFERIQLVKPWEIAPVPQILRK